MPHDKEPTYNVHLPGGNRLCADETEVTELLRQYMAARPDDPLLARVGVYTHPASPNTAERPLRLDRFIPELAQTPSTHAPKRKEPRGV